MVADQIVDIIAKSLTIDHYMAENLDHVMMKLPVIYLLDCTLNDCDLILKSLDQVLVKLYFWSASRFYDSIKCIIYPLCVANSNWTLHTKTY